MKFVRSILPLLLFSFTLVAQNSFSDHETQGKGLMDQRQWTEARKEFHAALSDAGTEMQSAIAAFRIAQTYKAEGNIDAAIDWCHQSLQYHSSQQAEQEMMQLKLQRNGNEVPASAIKTAFVEDNSIDLDILFGLNDASLTSEGIKQVDQLALAMSADEFKGKGFAITGHTDSSGTDEYNLKLSMARAISVRNALLKKTHIAAGLLKCEGKGKREPKYKEDSEENRRLNRRVQIALLN